MNSTANTASVPLQVAGQAGEEPFLLPSTDLSQVCIDPEAVQVRVTFNPNSSGLTYPNVK